MNQKVNIITGQKIWLESTAVTQLTSVANLPEVIKAVGLPDLHAGKNPIGMVLKTENIIYPHLIGNDIGCGMGLFKTGINIGKYNEKRWISRLNHIRELSDIETVNPYNEESPIRDFGTIGGGNHFAEFQQAEEIFLPEEFSLLELPENEIALLVHSGSRGYGQEIFAEFVNFQGYTAESEEAKAYFELHEDALKWARRNRTAVANKLIEWLGYSSEIISVIDLFHNFISRQGNTFIHRKGAVSAKDGLAVIPGSRGSLTYIVKPAEDCSAALDSLSHGAGRKWARSLCKSRIRNKYDRDSIRQTKLKSKVVCHDTELLYQEAPEAYKNIAHIIEALVEHKLITVVATLRPLITYKSGGEMSSK